MRESEWRKIFAFSIPYLRHHWWKFAGLMGILIVGSVVTNFTPYIWGEILDDITEGYVKGLIFWLLLYFLITYAALGLSVIEGYCGSKLNYAVEAEIKQKLLDRALHMRCSDLDNYDAGTLISRVTSDSGSVISFVFEVITSIVTIIINILAALFFAFRISTQLSLISLAFIPLSVASNLVFKKAFRAFSVLQKEYGDKLSSFLVGTLSHIPEMKEYCLEWQQAAQYDSLIKKGWSLQRKAFFLSTKMSLVSSVISSVSTIAVLVMSTVLIAQKRFTIGNMVSFQRYIDQLTGAVGSLLQMNYSAQSAGVAVDRINELFSMEEEPESEIGEAITVSRISFKDVSFAYRESEYVLNSIGFCIDGPGLYALVGENGCGKTTVLKLLMRYYSPVDGAIILNGRNIGEYAISSIRSSMGYYAKDVYIQDETLLSNLLLGSRHTASDGAPPELCQLCQMAGLTEFIDSLPDGLLTNVGENGKRLSSGQRQKIAVVRALLDEAPVLLFDEITSDLDGEAEVQVVNALAELAREKIVILVTHRVLPLQAAKQILVLRSGCVESMGDHRHLLQTSPLYQSLFEKQTQS